MQLSSSPAEPLSSLPEFCCSFNCALSLPRSAPLAGVRVVRAYRQEQAELDRFRRSNDEYLQRNRRLIVLQGFFFPSMSFFLGLGALMVIWLGSREVVRGRISLGEFVAACAAGVMTLEEGLALLDEAMVARVLGVLGLVGVIVTVPVLTTYAFWFALAGLVLLVLGLVIKGL